MRTKVEALDQHSNAIERFGNAFIPFNDHVRRVTLRLDRPVVESVVAARMHQAATRRGTTSQRLDDRVGAADWITT